MIIAISGSRGFIGGALVESLQAKGHTVKRIVRSEPVSENEIFCDFDSGCTDTDKLEGVDVIIHLAGESIAGRWDSQKKFDIYQSRIRGTDVITRAIRHLNEKPRHFICASAVGFYGNRDDEILDESSVNGTGFLADLCNQWESSTQRLNEAGIRVVNLRFSMVLDKSDGVLAKMLPVLKMGLGGVFASGSQYMSWIVLNDAIRAINFIIENHSIVGPVNVCSPNPVTNKEFTHTLAGVLRRPAFFKTPAWILKLILGGFAEEVLLSSARAVPQKLTNAGFQFEYSGLNHALKAILSIKN